MRERGSEFPRWDWRWRVMMMHCCCRSLSCRRWLQIKHFDGRAQCLGSFYHLQTRLADSTAAERMICICLRKAAEQERNLIASGGGFGSGCWRRRQRRARKRRSGAGQASDLFASRGLIDKFEWRRAHKQADWSLLLLLVCATHTLVR